MFILIIIVLRKTDLHSNKSQIRNSMVAIKWTMNQSS